MKELQNIYINSQNSLMVIVDMVNEFAKPGGKRYSEKSAQFMPGVISAIQKFSGRARDVGIPIIYIQTIRTLKEAEFTVFGKEPFLEMGTWAPEIVDELKPHKGDTVIQKFSHDPFFKTDLDRVLNKLVPEPTRCYAMLAGGGVGTCLYLGMMGFYLRDYWTVVLADCVYSPIKPKKEGTLGPFSPGYGYPNVFLSRSDLVEVSRVPGVARPAPIPGR